MNSSRIIGKSACFATALLLTSQANAQTASPNNYMAAYSRGDYATCAALSRTMLAEMKWTYAINIYNAACCYALAGQKKDAAELLKRAVDAPDFRVAKLAVDPDLASLHDLPEWPELVRLGQEKAKLGPVIGSGADVRYMRQHPAVLPKGMRLKQDISVVLMIGIADDDRPDHFIIEQSSGDPEVDQIAVVAASKWKYHAAIADGVKFPSYVRVPMLFRP